MPSKAHLDALCIKHYTSKSKIKYQTGHAVLIQRCANVVSLERAEASGAGTTTLVLPDLRSANRRSASRTAKKRVEKEQHEEGTKLQEIQTCSIPEIQPFCQHKIRPRLGASHIISNILCLEGAWAHHHLG